MVDNYTLPAHSPREMADILIKAHDTMRDALRAANGCHAASLTGRAAGHAQAPGALPEYWECVCLHIARDIDAAMAQREDMGL